MVGAAMSDPRVKEIVNAHFVPVLVDGYLHPDLCEYHEIYDFPTVIWMRPDGYDIERSLYLQTADDVLFDLNDVLLDLREQGIIE